MRSPAGTCLSLSPISMHDRPRLRHRLFPVMSMRMRWKLVLCLCLAGLLVWFLADAGAVRGSVMEALALCAGTLVACRSGSGEATAYIVMDTQYYDDRGSVLEIPQIAGDDSPDAQAINDALLERKAAYQIYMDAPYQSGTWCEVTAYPVTTERYLNLALLENIYPNYGTDGDLYAWVYDRQERRSVTVEEGADIQYSILMPGAVVKKGAVVSYAIVAENAVIGEEATVGTPPSEDPDWGIAVVGGGVTIGDKATVKPHAMIREDVKGGEQA